MFVWFWLFREDFWLDRTCNAGLFAFGFLINFFVYVSIPSTFFNITGSVSPLFFNFSLSFFTYDKNLLTFPLRGGVLPSTLMFCNEVRALLTLAEYCLADDKLSNATVTQPPPMAALIKCGGVMAGLVKASKYILFACELLLIRTNIVDKKTVPYGYYLVDSTIRLITNCIAITGKSADTKLITELS